LQRKNFNQKHQHVV